jgi:SAM-dependent methyltransferase
LKLRKRLQGKLKDYNLYRPFVYRKIGLEIGGPSDVFSLSGAIPLYPELIALDQCNYKVNASTAWAHNAERFGKDLPPGKSFIAEASELQVPDAGYDVVASSHVLEHCANPIKALKEWQRVLRPDGALILVLPFYGAMFDHNRCPTTFEHMENDFRRGIGEEDLSHLPEILLNHDLARDRAAGTWEEFRQRSLLNYENRCLHHHVFDSLNSRELLERTGWKVLSIEHRLPFHLCILASQ